MLLSRTPQDNLVPGSLGGGRSGEGEAQQRPWWGPKQPVNETRLEGATTMSPAMQMLRVRCTQKGTSGTWQSTYFLHHLVSISEEEKEISTPFQPHQDD
jgi:hypothetical protein